MSTSFKSSIEDAGGRANWYEISYEGDRRVSSPRLRMPGVEPAQPETYMVPDESFKSSIEDAGGRAQRRLSGARWLWLCVSSPRLRMPRVELTIEFHDGGKTVFSFKSSIEDAGGRAPKDTTTMMSFSCVSSPRLRMPGVEHSAHQGLPVHRRDEFQVLD